MRLERDGKNVMISVARHAGKAEHDPALQRQVDAKKKILAGATVLLDLAGENERLVYRRVLSSFLTDPLFWAMPSPTRDFDMNALRMMARIGAAWFNHASTDKTIAGKVNELMDALLTKPADRAIFGLN